MKIHEKATETWNQISGIDTNEVKVITDIAEFGDLQLAIEEWQRRNFGKTPHWQLTLGVNEEAGELAHAVLKNAQGIRGFDDEDKFRAAVADAVGDIAVYAMALCSRLDLDFSTIVRLTTENVLKRDWKKDAEHANEDVSPQDLTDVG